MTIDQIIKEIVDFVSDTSQPVEHTIDGLERVVEECEMRIDSLKKQP